MKKNYTLIIFLAVSLAAHVLLLSYVALPDHFRPDMRKLSIDYMLAKRRPPKPAPPPKPKPPPPKPQKTEKQPERPRLAPPPPPPAFVPENSMVIPGRLIETARVDPASPPDLEEYDTEPDPEPAPEPAPPPKLEPKLEPKIDIKAVIGEYGRRVFSMIEHRKVYPDRARRFGRQGNVALEFTVDSNGNLLGTRVSSSSGTEMLDEAAVKAVNDAAPFPALPPELDMDKLTLTITLVYRIN